jgi:hypothetical protein
MSAQTSRDLTDHSTIRCIRALEDIVQLVDTADEAAMITLTVAARLLIMSGQMMEKSRDLGFGKLSNVQQAAVLSGTVAAIISQGRPPQTSDINREVMVCVQKIKRMLINELVGPLGKEIPPEFFR